MAERVVIAVDGPAGSGKSTVARCIAELLGYRFLDSGAMYRALALKALRAGVPPDAREALGAMLGDSRIELSGQTVRLDGEDVSKEIRTPGVTRFVSRVAAVPEVREVMVAKQRAAYPGENLVAEGRDIGSVVFPDATAKFYLTATPEERARRRARESGRGRDEVLEEQRVRDAEDEGREHSPLVKAEGATLVDTTGLSIEEVVQRLAEQIRKARSD